MRMEFICNFSYENSYLGGLAGVTKRSQFEKVLYWCSGMRLQSGGNLEPGRLKTSLG